MDRTGADSIEGSNLGFQVDLGFKSILVYDIHTVLRAVNLACRRPNIRDSQSSVKQTDPRTDR